LIENKNIFSIELDGILSEKMTGENGKEWLETYFFGIIDILQPYNIYKKTAHNYKKNIRYAFQKIELDTVRPEKYSKRFLNYVNKIIECPE